MKKITFKIAILVAAFVVVSVAHAQTGGSWSNPTATPPGNNVSAPVHVGSEAQTKAGGFAVSGATSGLRIFDRANTTESWQWYANKDTTTNKSWLRLWNHQDLRDQVTVDPTGMRLFGNLWSGGVVAGTLQVTGGAPKTGMVLKSTDNFGTAAWSENSEGATVLVADLVLPNLTTIGSSGTNVTPFTVSVTGAKVGDLVSVAYPAGYSYDQMTYICGATTATVSAPNTVKVQFWNAYGGTTCYIPNGTYKINVIQKGGGPVQTVDANSPLANASRIYCKRFANSQGATNDNNQATNRGSSESLITTRAETASCPAGKKLVMHAMDSWGKRERDFNNGQSHYGTVNASYVNNSITCSMYADDISGYVSGVGLCI